MTDRAKPYYEAYRAKDARFDGQFVVAIKTTGVYCRPICTARLAKFESCQFFRDAAAAELAGFRPCQICHPEAAPIVRDHLREHMVERMARYLDAHLTESPSLADLEAMLGFSARHLRRYFQDAYGVTPNQYVQTRRRLLAKQLLTQTTRPISDVALAAGFSSVRRFNDVFRKHYGLAPSAFRKQVTTESSGTVQIHLTYRPPYDWHSILRFLGGRAILGVEVVTDDLYQRTVELRSADGTTHRGAISVRHLPAKNALQVELSESLIQVLPNVISRVRHLFDLYVDPQVIHEALAALDTVKPHLNLLGVRLPGCFDAFEMVVRAILGQQITVKAARTLAGRLVTAFGTPLETNVAGLTHLFPTMDDVLALGDTIEDQFGALGVTSARSRTIRLLATELAAKRITLSPFVNPQLTRKQLIALRGIGPWTADYLLMRAVSWPDIFLPSDAGIKNQLPDLTEKERSALADAYHPWRSYVVMCLWYYSDANQAKK